MFWKVLGAISLFNLLKSNQNDSNLNYEIEELKEKVNYLERDKKRSELKKEIKNLKYNISKIDKEKRIDLYKKAQDIIQEDLPHYAILYPMQNFAYKKNIKGIEVNKRGYFNFQNTISKY